MEIISATVENGRVSFTVGSLSPFAVVQGIYVSDTLAINSPNTGDKPTCASIFLLALGVLCISYRIRRRKNSRSVSQ